MFFRAGSKKGKLRISSLNCIPDNDFPTPLSFHSIRYISNLYYSTRFEKSKLIVCPSLVAPESSAKGVPRNGVEVPDTAHGNHSSLGTDCSSWSPSLGRLKCVPLKVGFYKDLKLSL